MSASNDDELAILRHQRKLELQKQIEAQASKQVEAEFAEQKKQIENSAIDSAMKKLLTPDARSRLATISLATPERSNQIVPVMELKTSIVKIRNINKGDSVSYGRTFIAKEEMMIGVIPIGYADGLPRALSNKGKVICMNENCDILGRVCMDLTIINLSEIDNPKVGDEVIIFGTGEIDANQVADIADTIPYEIVCGISKRVKRVYK